MKTKLTLHDYQSLAELRHQIRCFLHLSETAARAAGLEPRQHQLMLSLKGLPPNARARIGELAERLQVQHHSAVKIVYRLADGGYVRRQRGGQDRREVLLALTSKCEQVLRRWRSRRPAAKMLFLPPNSVWYWFPFWPLVWASWPVLWLSHSISLSVFLRTSFSIIAGRPLSPARNITISVTG